MEMDAFELAHFESGAITMMNTNTFFIASESMLLEHDTNPNLVMSWSQSKSNARLG